MRSVPGVDEGPGGWGWGGGGGGAVYPANLLLQTLSECPYSYRHTSKNVLDVHKNLVEIKIKMCSGFITGTSSRSTSRHRLAWACHSYVLLLSWIISLLVIQKTALSTAVAI